MVYTSNKDRENMRYFVDLMEQYMIPMSYNGFAPVGRGTFVGSIMVLLFLEGLRVEVGREGGQRKQS